MSKFHVGLILELMWPYRRHVDVFAGTQQYAQESTDWICEIDEFADRGGERVRHRLSRYDGLIARASPTLARLAKESNIPLVNVWYNSPEFERLPGIFPNFSEVGRQAATHLYERGFRQFGCLSLPRERAHRVMITGYHHLLEQLGYPCQCRRSPRYFYRTGESWNRFQTMLDDWIATWTPPVGIFVAFNDVTTRYVIHACQRHGLRVPEDVAFITSANEPLICELPPPSLTSVDLPYQHIGYLAAEMLDSMMRGETPPTEPVIVEPTGIIVRDSTDFFAGSDEVVNAAMRFIDQHAGEELSVDDIAVATGVSRRTLERRFQNCEGRTVAGELRRLRIQKAKRLLADTDLLIKQIAHEAGFRNSSRLNEIFLREEQMTPGEYRQSHRGASGS